MSRLTGLPPLIGDSPRLLVLGSFPGAKSLALNLYYGNPHNHFWQVVANTFGLEVPADYNARLDMLRDRGIASWDVYASCEREGSLDQAIRNPEANDIAAFLRSHPTIRRVLLNGTKAYDTFVKIMKNAGIAVESGGFSLDARRLLAFKLPSTSPVPSRQYRRAEDKFAAWAAALKME